MTGKSGMGARPLARTLASTGGTALQRLKASPEIMKQQTVPYVHPWMAPCIYTCVALFNFHHQFNNGVSNTIHLASSLMEYSSTSIYRKGPRVVRTSST